MAWKNLSLDNGLKYFKNVSDRSTEIWHSSEDLFSIQTQILIASSENKEQRSEASSNFLWLTEIHVSVFYLNFYVQYSKFSLTFPIGAIGLIIVPNSELVSTTFK